MTNKQKNAVLRQMMEQMKVLPAGKKTSTASLLGKVELSDEEFMFDAEDMDIFHEALMQQAKREGMVLVFGGFSCGMAYLDEFYIKK